MLSGLVSPIPERARLILVLLAVAVLVLLDLAQSRLRLPQRGTLIPQTVFAAGIARGIFRFGYEYGAGVRTLIPSAASYVLAVALVLIGLPWWHTVIIGAVFGASRTLAVLQYLVLGREGWAEFLSGHARVLERLGTVIAAALVVSAVLPL